MPLPGVVMPCPAAGLLPTLRGFYCLLIHLDRGADIDVGRWGRAAFPTGYYVYAGSALAGVAGRVARHLRVEKRLHWHIDYLLCHAQVVEVWAGPSRERLECVCAALLRTLAGATTAHPRFGASDCGCVGHLVYFPQRPSLSDLAEALAVGRPGTRLGRLWP